MGHDGSCGRLALRVLVLQGAYPLSGAGAIALAYARAFSRRHEVLFATCGPSLPEGEPFATELIPSVRRTRLQNYVNPGAITGLRALLRRFDPGLVSLHNAANETLSLAALPVLRGVRTLWTLHDFWPFCVRTYPVPRGSEGWRGYCLVCRRYPVLSIVNKALKEAVFALCDLEIVMPTRALDAPLDRSLLGRFTRHHVPHGVDIAAFTPGPAEASALGLDPSRAHVLFPGGQFAQRKGIDDLVAALTRIEPVHRPRLLYLGGPPPEAPGLEMVAPGRVEPREMVRWYRAADLVCLPSYAEVLPTALLEAAATGRPLIAYDVGGIPDILGPDAGVLVQPGDIEGLSHVLDALCRDRQRREALGACARARVVDRFGLEAFERRLLAIAEGPATSAC